MKHYIILPSENNGLLEDQPKEFISCCGDLYPFIATKANAIAYAKSVQKKFPNLHLKLIVSEDGTWGNQELIMEI